MQKCVTLPLFLQKFLTLLTFMVLRDDKVRT